MEKQTQQEKQKQEQLEQMMAKAQADLGEGERMKGEAAIIAQQADMQVDGAKMRLEHQKHLSEDDKSAFEYQLAKVQQELDTLKSRQDIDFDYEKLRTEEALKLTEMEHKYGLEKAKLAETHDQNQMKGSEDANTTT